ncbi:hypothetical protein F511_02743 [Dorcoceras hygrometricum]|uniref:Uncharacterized protein n=1 Tax=Dorcoceras hygrometricum TaxID=472368 RepID=A0A2Z7DE99_9LAMI|nr:hypothetical protein F511_02743 [Dorcoceras hygrometricum]
MGGAQPPARGLHAVRAPVHNVCARGAATYATSSRRWGGGCAQAACMRARTRARTTVRNVCARSPDSVRIVCILPCATCAHGYSLWAQRVRATCATCAHSYRPAGTTPVGKCARGVHGRHATPAAMCARDAHDPTIPEAICTRRAPGSDKFHEKIGTSTVGDFGLLIRSMTGIPIPSPVCTRKLDEDFTDGISSPERSERDFRRRRRQAAAAATDVGEERRGRIS